LSRKGYAESTQDIELPADRALDVNFRLLPAREAAPASASTPAAAPATAASSAKPPVTDDRPPEPQGIQTLTYVVLGAGVVTLGAAGSFEFLRRSAEKDAKNETTQTGYADALDTIDQRKTVARVLLGVGGALAVTGGVLLTLDLTRSSGTQVAGSCNAEGCWLGAKVGF
jgi:hypothetical protein